LNRPWIVLSVVIASTRVLAQTSDEDTRRNLLREAQDASDAGNHEQALSLAERAGEIRMHPSVRYFIAEQQRKLGQIANSMNSAKLCVLEATQNTQLKSRKEILRRCNDFLAERQKSVARIVISFPQPVPPHTQVWVGDQAVPELLYGRAFFVIPGQTRVQASAPGCAPFEHGLFLLPGEEVTVSVSLSEEPRAPEPVPSTTDPNSVASQSQPPGAPTSDLGVRSTIAESRSTPTGVYILLGAGGACLGASALFLILRNNQIHELEAQCSADQRSVCPDVPAVRSLQSRASRYNTLTNVTLAVGTAAVAGGAVWYILEKTRSAPISSRAQLQIEPTRAGAVVAITGAF
jgi:hypothetical protein